MKITSLQNNHIKHVIRLQRRRYRDQHGQFALEGYRAILRATQNGFPLDTLYFCPEFFLGDNEESLIEEARAGGCTTVEVDAAPFKKMAQRQRPEGLIAVAQQNRRRLTNFAPPNGNGFYLFVEAIEKPGNLGAIMRSADGAGVDALVVCSPEAETVANSGANGESTHAPPQTDIYHPEVLRASAGTIFTQPIFEATTPEAIKWCQQHAVTSLAATPFARSLYTAVVMRGPLAIVVGSEQYGLSEVWLHGATAQVRLPMRGQADSLNVAMAATLLCYEAVRQRYDAEPSQSFSKPSLPVSDVADTDEV